MSFMLPDLSGTLGTPSLTTNTVGELVTLILLAEKIRTRRDDRRRGMGRRPLRALRQAGHRSPRLGLDLEARAGDADEFEAALKTWLAALNRRKDVGGVGRDVGPVRARRRTVDAIARKGSDVILLRHLAKEKVIPVLQRLSRGDEEGREAQGA